ncbi:MAG: glycosyltransferase family 1 protein [Candidatus Omnitrophota bacterium]|nr:glycosyltransferase family 1 protein [Candidatus Omnitrophota bacterium]
MRIGIDIRSTLKKTNTGIGRYTINLVKSLLEIDRDNSYYFYNRKRLFDFKRRLPDFPAKNYRHVRNLPEIDAFHTSSYDLEKPKKAKKLIVTVHDVIIKAYPAGHSEKTIKEIDVLIKRVLGEADLLIADSFNTKSDLMKFYSAPESKIHVIYPGVNPLLSPLQPRRLPKASYEVEEYILFVGTLEPRKNIQGLIKAFNYVKKNLVGAVSDRPLQLYIAGMKGWMYEDIFKEYERSDFKGDIIFKGYAPDEELAALYKNASVFVYPSFYEGFGFPIVEAFGYGAPVVTSRTSSCGEIAGGAALVIDPENYREIGEAILKIINSDTLRQGLIAKGLERAKEFTWENTARKFLKIFTQY